jgi:thioredoxin reductase (NADPH)
VALPSRPIIETRYDQMFPTLDAADIDRLLRFGETRSYGAGAALVTAGEVAPGVVVILSGEVAVTQRSIVDPEQHIVTHSTGSFIGELAQLAGRPALVDARATKPVEALVIATRRIPELLVAEAEIGERIMRALILRRVAIGDVRSGSTKRVAAAVGEGAQAVATIHSFLTDVTERRMACDGESERRVTD